MHILLKHISSLLFASVLTGLTLSIFLFVYHLPVMTRYILRDMIFSSLSIDGSSLDKDLHRITNEKVCVYSEYTYILSVPVATVPTLLYSALCSVPLGVLSLIYIPAFLVFVAGNYLLHALLMLLLLGVFIIAYSARYSELTSSAISHTLKQKSS